MLNRTKSALPFLLLALGAAGSVSAAEIQEPVYSESDYQAFAREDCMICHADEELEAYSERDETLKLFLDEIILNGSVHEGLLRTSFCSCSARCASRGQVQVSQGSPRDRFLQRVVRMKQRSSRNVQRVDGRELRKLS